MKEMTKEEKAIRNIKRSIKQRKLHIALLLLLVAFMICASGWVVLKERDLDAMITPEYVQSLASYENLKDELPILFTHFYAISASRAKLMIAELLIAGLTGLCVMCLIIMYASTLNGRYLILSMWERIKTLETQVASLKSDPDINENQPPATDKM